MRTFILKTSSILMLALSAALLFSKHPYNNFKCEWTALQGPMLASDRRLTFFIFGKMLLEDYILGNLPSNFRHRSLT